MSPESRCKESNCLDCSVISQQLQISLSTLQDLPRYDDQPWSGKPPLQSDSQSVETEPTLVIVTIANESTSSIFKDNGIPRLCGGSGERCCRPRERNRASACAVPARTRAWEDINHRKSRVVLWWPTYTRYAVLVQGPGLVDVSHTVSRPDNGLYWVTGARSSTKSRNVKIYKHKAAVSHGLSICLHKRQYTSSSTSTSSSASQGVIFSAILLAKSFLGS